MINRIKFKNYKLFKSEQTLDLKPLTIVIGKNNTGKSAILKLPVLLEKSFETSKNTPIFKENGDVEIARNYPDLLHAKNRALELFIENEKESLKVEIDINSGAFENTNPILNSWKCNDLELKKLDKEKYEYTENETEYVCEFQGLQLVTAIDFEKESSAPFDIPYQNFSLKTDFISGIRAKAEPYYDYNPKEMEKSNKDGRNLYDFLIQDFLTTDKMYFNKINDWIEGKFEGWKLDIDTDREPYPISLIKGDLKVNLVETGMGIAQSLPLITRAFKPCKEETLIIIEEPECHLHPYAHAQMAQLFADSVIEDANKKYLIETHSINFILRIRRLIAEGKLSVNHLALYYVDFDEDSNQSHLKEVMVDDKGAVSEWPAGVFTETSLETRAIFNAQLNDL